MVCNGALMVVVVNGSVVLIVMLLVVNGTLVAVVVSVNIGTSFTVQVYAPEVEVDPLGHGKHSSFLIGLG